MARPLRRTPQSEDHEDLIKKRAKELRQALAAAERAQEALGAAIYQAVDGGHLSEHSAARCARISRSMARRYTLGKGDRRRGRKVDQGR